MPANQPPATATATAIAPVLASADLPAPPPALRRGRASQPGVTWSCTFPARPDQVGAARQFLAAILTAFPAAADAVLCLSELASNAVLHSRSSREGGMFTVRATLDAALLRVEVRDEGGPWNHHGQSDAQRGRGLAIVGHLAPRWGVEGDDGRRTVWFETDPSAGAF